MLHVRHLTCQGNLSHMWRLLDSLVTWPVHHTIHSKGKGLVLACLEYLRLETQISFISASAHQISVWWKIHLLETLARAHSPLLKLLASIHVGSNCLKPRSHREHLALSLSNDRLLCALQGFFFFFFNLSEKKKQSPLGDPCTPVFKKGFAPKNYSKTDYIVWSTFFSFFFFFLCKSVYITICRNLIPIWVQST